MFLKTLLAVTYEKIATGGRDAFYKGDNALSMHMKSQAAFVM